MEYVHDIMRPVCFECKNDEYFEVTLPARVFISAVPPAEVKVRRIMPDIQQAWRDFYQKIFRAANMGWLPNPSVEFYCGVCSSTDIRPWFDTLEPFSDEDNPVTQEMVREICTECLNLHARLSGDRSLFYLMLDMDLHCNACPVSFARERLGIDTEVLQKKAESMQGSMQYDTTQFS